MAGGLDGGFWRFRPTHERNVAHHDDPRHSLAIAVRRRQIELEPAQLRLAIGLLRELLPVDVQVECDQVEDCPRASSSVSEVSV